MGRQACVPARAPFPRAFSRCIRGSSDDEGCVQIREGQISRGSPGEWQTQEQEEHGVKVFPRSVRAGPRGAAGDGR